MYHFSPKRVPNSISTDNICLSCSLYKDTVTQKGNGDDDHHLDDPRSHHGSEGCPGDLQV